jgi:hypothetical protein
MTDKLRYLVFFLLEASLFASAAARFSGTTLALITMAFFFPTTSFAGAAPSFVEKAASS